LEIHNPTSEEIKTTVYSPENTPFFGGMNFEVVIPPGDSVFYEIKDKKAFVKK